MNFWSDVEKEYNELSGDPQMGEDDSAPEFNGLLSDIRKDLKKIPKTEVFPSLSSNDVEEEVLPEENSDSDQEEGKRSLGPKSKKKRCKVGGKTYEVGERWKDEKTGKNMICILMNVPKNVQPLLADADILAPSTTATEDNPEWKRPSVEPQWSYTATPVKKTCQDNVSSGKSSGKPDKAESNPTNENKSNKENETLKSSDQTKQETNASAIDKPEIQSEEKTNDTNKEPEIIVVDPPEPNSEESKGEDAEKENESEDEDDDRESEEESDSNEKNIDEKTKPKEKEPNTVKTQQTDTEDKKDENRSEIDNDSKVNIKSEAIKLMNSEYSENMDTKSKNLDEKDEPQQTKKNSSEKEVTENTGHVPTNTEDISKNNDDQSAESKDDQQPEKGQPIYTKETVVVQRKLIKTEQTIETTETDKTKQ